jgi:hypothetical protein
MHTRHRTIFHLALGLVLIALLTACGSENNGETVTVNLSLIVNAGQAQQGPASRLFSWIDRWFPGATTAWAQAVTDIASIQVQITGPGIPTPASTTVAVSNPTSGQEIPVTIQAPVGPNRIITVSAFNGDSPPVKIFSGTSHDVNLTAGAPVNLEIALVRLFTVTVQKQGNGSGTVTSSPASIDCGGACSGQFQQGVVVSLNAAAAPGSAFVGWGGACSGTGPCSVTGDATVTARFEVPISTNRLTVTLGGNGIGMVTSNPTGISCPGTCAADFATGITVTLSAAPANGSAFNGFSGAGCSGSGSTCVVVIVGNPSVTATFTTGSSSSNLTVQKNGMGSGTVTSQPAGIDCGPTCVAGFPTGTVVTLTPTPAAGSIFSGWNGPRCGGTGPCTITLDTDFTAFPVFNPAPTDLLTLTVNKQGRGDGTVTSNPAGISCGPGCGTSQASFQRGMTVTLTATPDGGSSFNDWHGGPCNMSSSLTCQLQMNDSQTVSAHFEDSRGPGGGGRED